MKFGIILCKKCHHALGIDLRFKSTTCAFCNKKIKFLKDDIKYTTDSEKDLVIKISNFNRQIGEEVEFNIKVEYVDQKTTSKDRSSEIDNEIVKPQTFEDLDPFKRIALKYKNENESILLIEKLIKALCQELDEITLDDFQKLLMECSLSQDKAVEYLDQLKGHGIVFEPKIGIYKLIE